MADSGVPGPVENSASIREAVCVNTRKIFDSCRDKDCVDDLRVYPTVSSQSYIENALSIRPQRAELLYVDVSVEPVGFNRGYFTVDCTYFYRVTGERKVIFFGQRAAALDGRRAAHRRGQFRRSYLPALQDL